MLRETKCFQNYPSKSVIEDIVTRSGLPDEDSFTPFAGRMEDLNSQFSGSSQQSRFKLADFLEYVKNRDLDPSAIKVADRDGILQSSVKHAGGFKTLEDLAAFGNEDDTVGKYLMNLCVGFKKDSESAYNQTRDYYTRTIRNYNGDDEDEIEEKYLLEQEDDRLSNEEYEQVLTELPYLIKSMWSYSKRMQGNLFSFAFAYADIVERKHGSTNVSVQDFRNYTTYGIKSDGTFWKTFIHANDNKYTIYQGFMKVFTAPGSHMDVYSLCMKFLNSLKILGIDFHNEDPRQFNNDFIKSMVCTYLPSNEQYINEYKNVDPEIIVALSPENVFATAKSSLYIPVEEDTESYDWNQNIYFVGEQLRNARIVWESNRKRDNLFFPDEESTIEILTEYLRIHTGDDSTTAPIDRIGFHPYTDILYLKNKDENGRPIQDYLILDGRYFGTYRGSYDYKVIFTRYGFIVPLEDRYDRVFCMTAEDCLKKLEEYNGYENTTHREHWKPIGVYD